MSSSLSILSPMIIFALIMIIMAIVFFIPQIEIEKQCRTLYDPAYNVTTWNYYRHCISYPSHYGVN